MLNNSVNINNNVNIMLNNSNNSNNSNNNINNDNNVNDPWCEKYRPECYDNIILNKSNKIIFDNMLNSNKLYNLLFYGPPGTGKTTTVINLINKIQIENYGKIFKSLIIHLNASDDRGIDIIRNNIYNFINSENIFTNGTKFIILDEVDYMTKIAQQALKCIIQENNNKDVIFCLICNYISKIDYSLVDEFIKIKFNNLPKNKIMNFLENINNKENLNLSEKTKNIIIDYFNSDIRNMLNFLQSNKYLNIVVLQNNILEKLFNTNLTKSYIIFNNNIKSIENLYRLTVFQILKKYIYYILINKINYINKSIINDYEYIIHNMKNDNNYVKYIYIITKDNIIVNLS